MSVRRFSVTSVLDVSSLEGYYGRLDVYASFTDDGEFDMYGAVDGNLRPYGVFAYMINDVVGRRSRESTLYARVFRYRERSKQPLNVQQYTMDDYELDYQKMLRMFPDHEEVLDEIYTLVPGQLSIKNAFAHIWQLTFRFAAKLSKGLKSIKETWAELFQKLEYDAVIDKRGTGIIDSDRKPCLIVLGDTAGQLIEDLEIVSTQVYKKEQNSRIYFKIARFNRLTAVANARNRIKK